MFIKRWRSRGFGSNDDIIAFWKNPLKTPPRFEETIGIEWNALPPRTKPTDLCTNTKHFLAPINNAPRMRIKFPLWCKFVPVQFRTVRQDWIKFNRISITKCIRRNLKWVFNNVSFNERRRRRQRVSNKIFKRTKPISPSPILNFANYAYSRDATIAAQLYRFPQQ